MSETLSNEQLTDLTRSIERRVGQLAIPYEDALAHRVFEKAQTTFRAWLTVWLGVSSIVVGLVGYLGYDEVIKASKQRVEEQISAQVTVQLQNEVRAELTEVREQIKDTLIKSSLDDVSKLDADLAQLLSDTQNAIDQRIKEFATKLAPALKEPGLPKALVEKPRQESLSGYAFFGVHSGDGWSERNFSIVGKSNNDKPIKGDKVIALVPVNARQGVIELTPRGWINKPAVGLIHAGRELTVVDTQAVAGGSYIWFQFEASN